MRNRVIIHRSFFFYCDWEVLLMLMMNFYSNASQASIHIKITIILIKEKKKILKRFHILVTNRFWCSNTMIPQYDKHIPFDNYRSQWIISNR